MKRSTAPNSWTPTLETTRSAEPSRSSTAAAGVVEALLAGERYVVTHGNLVAAVDERAAELRRAADAAAAGVRG